jgi:HK97 family phage major capsid protein
MESLADTKAKLAEVVDTWDRLLNDENGNPKSNVSKADERRAKELEREYNRLSQKVTEMESTTKRKAVKTVPIGTGKGDGSAPGSRPTGPIFQTKDGKTVQAYRGTDRLASGDEGNVGVVDVIKAQIGGGVGGLQKSLATDTNGGGSFIPTPVSERIFDLSRANARVMQAGALTMDMPDGNMTLVRVTGDPATAWKAENASGSHSDVTFAPVELKRKMLFSNVKITLELIYSAGNAEQAVRNAISQAMGLAMDKAALNGSGTGAEPEGILNTSGIQTVTVGGTLSNYADFLSAVGKLRSVNVADADMDALVHSRVATDLEGLQDSDNNPLVPPRPIRQMQDDNRWHITNQLPLSGSPETSDAIVGDFSNVVFGITRQIAIETSMEAADSTGSAWMDGQVWVRAYGLMDTAILRPDHFVHLADIEVS